MKLQSPILRIVVGIAVAISVSACDKLGLGGDKSPTAPSGPPSPGSTIVYAAIGASDANGVGSSVQCAPFTDCPNGMGYVPVAARALRARGFTVDLTNLGIATAVIGRDFQTLATQHGRTVVANFIDQEMPFVPSAGNVVTIFAGVNDVNVITAALGDGAGGSDPNGYIDAQVRAFGADYATLMQGIRAKASKTRFVILNVPNVGAMPFLSTASVAQKQAAQRASVAMTRTVVNPLAASDVAIVDLMCDPRSYQTSFYSSDGLHPNDAGYANIAASVVAAITATAFNAPQSSCASMTLIP
jgi:lysophospholipase L1-like esterase